MNSKIQKNTSRELMHYVEIGRTDDFKISKYLNYP
jgi:hypothetical protein